MKTVSFVALLLLCCLFFGPGCAAQAEDLPAETAAPETISSGSRGEEVLRLQNRLYELGYDPGGTDGIFGGDTRKAVKAFQRRNGLSADGVAGPKTLAVLYSEEAVSAPAAAAPVDVLAGKLPMLVNRQHPVDETFTPANLVLLTDVIDPDLAKIKYPSTQAVSAAADALITLLQAAREDGIRKWQISAAYRSWEDQESMLNAKTSHYLKKNEGWSRSRARSAALKSVAEPGCSEHHLGLAFDVNVPGASTFQGTKQCTWLHKNCWDYGFIVRYQKGKEAITGFTAEAWHIRYVGLEHALYMRDHDLCLEEYLEGIESGEITPPLREVEEEIMLDD